MYFRALLASVLSLASASLARADELEIVPYFWVYGATVESPITIFKNPVDACDYSIRNFPHKCIAAFTAAYDQPGWACLGPCPGPQTSYECEFRVRMWPNCSGPVSSESRNILQGYADALRSCPPTYVLDWDWVDGHQENYRCSRRADLTPPDQCPLSDNPVQVAKGWKFWSETDFGYPFELVRYYTSRPPSDMQTAGFGPQWRHNYERMVIKTDDPTRVWLMRQQGAIVLFSKDSGGIWRASAGSYLRMTDESFGYRVYSESDDIEDYDTDGKLTSVLLRDGRQFTLTYQPYSTLLEKITDNKGRSLTFTMTADTRRIASITDSAGNTRQYTYLSNADPQLTSISSTDAGGMHLRTYHYETSPTYLLTGITSETGNRYATYTYDSARRVATTKHFADATHPIEQYTELAPRI